MQQQRTWSLEMFKRFCVGKGGPVFVYINAPGIPVGGREVCDAVQKLTRESFELIEVLVDNWDTNLSPWIAPSAFKKGNFTGGGVKTLNWVVSELLNGIKKDCSPEQKFYIVGYSLAGLFAMWSLYETEVFDGAICCSGSLWFPDWDEYMRTAKLNKPGIVYISLGGKEETTKNPVMQSVGVRTRNQLKLLKADPNCIAATLEMNPGGHFSDTANRIAKGIAYVLEKQLSVVGHQLPAEKAGRGKSEA